MLVLHYFTESYFSWKKMAPENSRVWPQILSFPWRIHFNYAMIMGWLLMCQQVQVRRNHWSPTPIGGDQLRYAIIFYERLRYNKMEKSPNLLDILWLMTELSLSIPMTHNNIVVADAWLSNTHQVISNIAIHQTKLILRNFPTCITSAGVYHRMYQNICSPFY